MELDPVNWEFAVLQSHDFAFRCFGRDLEARWQSFAPDDKGMVTRRLERIGKLGENAGVVVPDRRSFSMHQALRRDDLAAENRADALMAEADAEDRHLRAELANDFVADPSVLRPARARRDADSFRTQRFDFANGDFVVAF